MGAGSREIATSRASTFGLGIAVTLGILGVGAPRPARADAAGMHTAYCYTNLPGASGNPLVKLERTKARETVEFLLSQSRLK